MSDRAVTQLELSDATGISRPTLQRKLGGHRAFDLRELAAIADHFDVSVADLMAVDQ